MINKQRRRAGALAAFAAALSGSSVALSHVATGAHGVSGDFILGGLIGAALGLAVTAVVLIQKRGRAGGC